MTDEIDALNRELTQLHSQINSLKNEEQSLRSQIRHLEEARRLDSTARLSIAEEKILRDSLLSIGHCICGSHAIIGFLTLIEEEPTNHELSSKFEIKFNQFKVIQDIGNTGLLYNIHIITKSAHVMHIVRETFKQEGNDSLTDEQIDELCRINWTTNWDNYCRIIHVDLDE